MNSGSVASEIRLLAAEWTIRANGGYLAQACGSAEIFATLYCDVLDLSPSTAPRIPPKFESVPNNFRNEIRGSPGSVKVQIFSSYHPHTTELLNIAL